jgi:23S rRNA pseudouridine1911/1915/1917 synthase
MQRQALHAARLALVHPVTSAPMNFEIEPPVDFAAALECWGLKYNWASF